MLRWAAGDMDDLQLCFAHDAVWHEPGHNIYSGDRVGWLEIRDELLALLGPLSRGAFRAELLDIAIGPKYVVAIHRRPGGEQRPDFRHRKLRDRSLVARGRIQEVWASYAKQDEVDAFWA